MENIISVFEENFSQDFIGSLLRIIIVIVVAWGFLHVALNVLNNIEKKNIKAGRQPIEHFAKPLIKVVVYFIAILAIFSEFGINVTSLIALLSVFSAALALAAQSVLSQLFGGITLIVNKPFQVGDFIKVGDYEGKVKSIGIYYTVLNTIDSRTISLPNGTLSTCDIINYSTKGGRVIKIIVGAGYDCKIEDVKKALRYAIEITPNILKEPESFVEVYSYDSSDIKYEIRTYVKNDDFLTEFKLMENIRTGFEKYNVFMSYNHVILHNAKN